MRPQTMGIPNFAPAPAQEIEATDDGNTSVTVQPTIVGTAFSIPILMPSALVTGLIEHGWTDFGARAGHVVIAKPGAPARTLRLHPIITGAPETYRCLYRNGDPTDLTIANLGFSTKGGYDWWLVPREGERDPAWNKEGLAYRMPGAILSKRPVLVPPRPPFTPTPHRKPAPFVPYRQGPTAP